MVFAPVPKTKVLFCIWETRVRDYAAYTQANAVVGGPWRDVKYNGVPVSDGPEHPVVMVSWREAMAFCQWLTRKERETASLDANQEYRLPTDMQWSLAAGLEQEPEGTPADKSLRVKGFYPWGTSWPPPVAAGNYADMTAKKRFPYWWTTIKGYDDGYATTAPVGKFNANKYGLYDLGGNVWEWCEDWYDQVGEYRVERGASWQMGARRGLQSACRSCFRPGGVRDDLGFRVVLGLDRAHGSECRSCSGSFPLASRTAGPTQKSIGLRNVRVAPLGAPVWCP
jgi:formylglycine-generating enzyme required for sulfatase activity